MVAAAATVQDHGGERDLGPVGVAEEEHQLTYRLHHRHDIPALILKTVTLSSVRLTPAATGDGIDGELRLEEWLHKRPVGRVVAEGAVHEDQGRATAVPVVGDGGGRG